MVYGAGASVAAVGHAALPHQVPRVDQLRAKELVQQAMEILNPAEEQDAPVDEESVRAVLHTALALDPWCGEPERLS